MELREINVTPHIAQNKSRRSAIDERTTRHPGYTVSQRIRKRIEEGFGWMKTIAGLKKTKYRGLERVGLEGAGGAFVFDQKGTVLLTTTPPKLPLLGARRPAIPIYGER